MTRYLLATASVHLTAAACDYLDGRLDDGDAVRVVHVELGDSDAARNDPDAARNDSDAARDGGDALNVARTRLAGTDVETVTREGDPGEEILAAAGAFDADEVLVGAREGDPGEGRHLGETAAYVVREADRPVLVVPLPDL